MSVARLGELLAEREALRNEALLLLGALTRGSSEAQKMLAFEGAFERLLNIIREEGGLDGGDVVQVRTCPVAPRGCQPGKQTGRSALASACSCI